MKTILLNLVLLYSTSIIFGQFKLSELSNVESFKQNEEMSAIILEAEKLFMDKVNDYRKSKKRSNLAPANDAMIMALNHNLWMRQNKKFTHSERKGTTYFTGSSLLKRLEFVRNKQPQEIVGENIALINLKQSELSKTAELPELLAEKFFDIWLNSPPHRENLLTKEFNFQGISILKLGNSFYGTHVFTA